VNRLPKIKERVLAGLATAQSVRLTCKRPRKFARELSLELQMCDIKVEREDRSGTGTLLITWKVVP
jgi:hypothetical protein